MQIYNLERHHSVDFYLYLGYASTVSTEGNMIPISVLGSIRLRTMR